MHYLRVKTDIPGWGGRGGEDLNCLEDHARNNTLQYTVNNGNGSKSTKQMCKISQKLLKVFIAEI